MDANNLNGYAVSKSLPTDGFKWKDSKKSDSSKYSNNM